MDELESLKSIFPPEELTVLRGDPLWGMDPTAAGEVDDVELVTLRCMIQPPPTDAAAAAETRSGRKDTRRCVLDLTWGPEYPVAPLSVVVASMEDLSSAAVARVTAVSGPAPPDLPAPCDTGTPTRASACVRLCDYVVAVGVRSGLARAVGRRGCWR